MIGEHVEIAAALVNIEELVAVASIIVRSRILGDAFPRTFGIIRGDDRPFVFPGQPLVGAARQMDLAQ